MVIQKAAEALLQAETDKKPIAPFTSSTDPDFCSRKPIKFNSIKLTKRLKMARRLKGRKLG